MRDKNLAAVLALFLGPIGVHKFYLGQIGWGIVYLAFCWSFVPALAGLVEFVILALMTPGEFHRRFNLPQPAPYALPVYAPYAQLPPGMPPPTRRWEPPRPDLAEALKKLHELRIAGLLTDEEFAQQKKKLLDSM